MTVDEAAKLEKLQILLFQQCRGLPEDSGFNVADDVMHACFSMLLVHSEKLLSFENNVLSHKIRVSCTQCECDLPLLYKAGAILRAEGNVTNLTEPAQHASEINHKNKMEILERKVDHLMRDMAYLRRQNAILIDLLRSRTPTESLQDAEPQQTTIKLASAIQMNVSIATFVYSWYMNEPWALPRAGKSESTFLSEVCSTLAILKIVYGSPYRIETKPCQLNDNFKEWKTHLRSFAEDVMITFNRTMKIIDRKKDTGKASGVRRRFGNCEQTPEFVPMILSFAKLYRDNHITNDLVDEVTPPEFLKEGNHLVKYVDIIKTLELEEEMSAV